MATPQYQSILSTKIDDIKDVPLIPEGSYLATISGTPKVDKFGQKQTPGAEFSFRLNGALEDVDPEALRDAGGIPEMPMTYTFWDTPKAGGILRQFLKDVLRVEQTAEQTPLDVFPELPGLQCIVKIQHKKNNKTGRSFPQIAEFANAG